ncbi:type VII secretion-associated serine protease mycosin [Streptomyces sp. SYSU K217416]
MHTSRLRINRHRPVVSAGLGLLLAGVVVTPAHAESVRSQQWHLDAMHAEEMWKVSTGKGVTVAVIDSGVDATHPDLQGQVLNGKDLAPKEDGDEHTDYDGHGTGMAGLIAGTGRRGGGNGAFGLAPGVKILPIRTPDIGLDANQIQAGAEFNQAVSDGIRYAADSGAKVINVSMGVLDGSEELAEAVKYALGKGSLIFAAVGNNGEQDNEAGYPAGTPGVVGVGAVGKDLKKTNESSFGPLVDFSAPGEDIVTACGGKTGLCKTHGTSDATALTSASAALIWSKYPKLTNNQVLRVMLNTVGGPQSGNKRTNELGYGAPRPRIALKNPGDVGPADEYPLPDLAAAAPSSPPTEASESDGSPAKDGKPGAAAPAAREADTSIGLWIGLGVGAAALIGTAVAVPLVRSRRSV